MSHPEQFLQPFGSKELLRHGVWFASPSTLSITQTRMLYVSADVRHRIIPVPRYIAYAVAKLLVAVRS